MYQINYYDLPVYDDQLQELFPVLNAKLNLEVNDAGGLNFSIPSVHPNFADLKKLKLGIAVVKNGKTIFKGRIVKDTQDFNNSKSFECEGKLAVLNDTIYRPYDFAGSPTEYFTSLIENHNSMVEDEKKFIIGEITVTDPNDYITRSSIDHKTTWELLKDLVGGLGGYLHIRYEEDGDYIDWLDDFKYTNTQKIEFAENLLDIKQEIIAEETYTACIPLGAKIEITNEDGTTETTDERLTVASVNDGKDYIYNADKVAEYGWKFAPASAVTWDDVTRPENLLTKATDYLNNTGVMLAATLELSAVDLAYTDADINSFEFCQYVQVVSIPHNLEKSYLLSKIDVDLLHPQNTKITLGDSVLTLYDALLGQQQNIDGIVQRVEKIESDYVINEQLEDLGDFDFGGGRNLLLRTRDFGGGWVLNPVTRVGYGYEDGFTYVDFPAEAEDGTNRWVYNYKSALKKEDIWGKEFVLSYELRADEVWTATGDNLAIEFALANESAMGTRTRYRVVYITPQITTEWVRFEYKGTFNESLFSGGTGSFDDCTHFWIRFYNTMNKPLQVRKFKLELGNQATEWTEAPEDTALAYSGGRNLILDSDVVRSSASYCVNTSAIETSGGHYVPSEPLVAGEEYTITACITPAEGVKCYNVNASHGNANICYLYVNGTERQITSATFKARYAEGYTPEDDIINANLLFYRLPNDGTVTGVSTIHWIKVEKGNKASDWTPAPEDVNTQINQELIETSSQILQTAEDVTIGILAGYTKASDLEAYKKEVENLFKTNEEGFSFEFSQLEEKVSALGNEIVEQEQYIRLIEGEIHIGKSDSPITSVYTNDALEFRYNGQMVARFTNEVLEVRNISVENQIGFFDQWAIRRGAYVDGVGYNLNDIWIGG